MTPRFFIRCHSSASVGSFTSGRGAVGERLDDDELLAEFQRHRFLNNREPTALVSVSSRFVNTLSRALVKWYGIDEDEYQVEQEPAHEIFITFIKIPAPDIGICHHARTLAEQLEDEENPVIYASEYVFEWEIPPKYIIHTVSLQTLIDRGLGIGRYIAENGRPPSTDTLKDLMATSYLDDSIWQYEVGLNIGLMAKCFGARPPVLDIARQSIDECTVEHYYDYHDLCLYVLFGSMESHKQCIVFDQLDLRDDGIHTAIFEWWLCDETFNLEYDQYKEWVSELEQFMEQDYFYDDELRDVYGDPVKEDRELQEIKIRHERMKADIEGAAVELGL